MRCVAEAWRTSVRARMWGVILLAALLPSCASAPRYTTRTVARPRATSAAWPRREVLDLALRAYSCGRAQGEFNHPLLTVIDYSLPSTSKRLWVIDLSRRRVLFNELVAHGANSGDTYASAFSNRVGSRQSSLGLFRTDETYYGRHGRALRLSGLEPGINDNARERAIVMHGAPYVNPVAAEGMGRLGRSWGCPAVRTAVARPMIDTLKQGQFIYAHGPGTAELSSCKTENLALMDHSALHRLGRTGL